MLFFQDDNASLYGEASTVGYDVTDLFSETAVGTQATRETDLEKKTSDFLGDLIAAPDKVSTAVVCFLKVKFSY